MEDFSFIRDFKNIQWKRTIGLNLLRSAIAGVVWFFIITVTGKAHGSALPMLFFPLVFSLFFLPFGIFASFLSKWGVPYVGWATVFFTFLVFVADPIMYILHRTIPRIVPVEKYKFLSLHLVIFVLNNSDLAANDEYNAPKEIDRAKVKELLSSRIRPDDNEDEAEVNFLKEEVVVNEAIRAGKTVGGPPKLEISNSIFNFPDLRAGSTSTDTFTIINAGGDKLSGSIKTNRKWLKVFQSEIDPTQRKQDVIFRINTSGLAFGFHDSGTIEIRSNAGIERVSVTISVEAAAIASLRREINIPAIAGIGVLGVAIAVTVLVWQMALKTEKEAKLAKSTIKLAKPIIKQEPLQRKDSQMQESTQKLEEQNIPQERKEFYSSAQTTIYFVTGHGERQFEDFDPHSGISGIANSLKQNNCRLAPLNILTAEKIPDDCDVLVIAGPTKAYLTEELNIIRNYLENKGKLLLMLEPAVTPNNPTGFKALLAEYGIVVRDDVVVYSKVNMPLFGIQTVKEIYVGKDEYAESKITDCLKSFITTLFGACSVSPASPNNKMHYQATVLINAPEGSWGETDVANLQQKKPELNVDVDLQGIVSLAVVSQLKELHKAVTRSHPDMANDPNVKSEGARLVVIGDVNFASNEYIENPGNAGLFLNSVNWLLNKEKQHTAKLEIPTDSKTAQSTLAKKETEKSASQEAVNNCFDTVSPDRWKGEYYNNGNLSGSPSMIRDDGDGLLCFVQKRWNPDNINGIVANNISVRWTRTVYFDGTAHQFAVKSNEGFKLYVDDELILDSWLNQSLATFTSPVKPSAGNHLVKVEYHIINGGVVFELSWQALSTTEQPTVQAPVTINISGEWEGWVGNKLAELSLVQDGNSLSGNIVYDPVTVYLSGEINSTQVVLKGTGFKSRYDMGGEFSLDTFYGTIMNQDGDFIRGKFTDEAGRSGSWYVTKSKSSPQIAAQKPLPSHDILSEDEVKAVIEKRVNLSNKNESLDEIMRYYQDSVDYYAYGVVLKDVIRREINGNYKMWPERERRISSSITVIPGNTDNEKTAKFTVHSIAKKGKEVLENENNYEMTLRKQENSILIIREKSNPNTQKTTDNYKPNTTTSAPQARLTKAMQKNPYISFHDNDHNCRFLLSNAKVTLLHNDSLQISSQKDSFAIDCTWSSSGSAYVGTWQRYEDGRGRVQGKITLWPQYNSDGEIKCFSGYIRNWNDPPADVIKIQTVWCRCSNPPNHNPGAREQYRKPNSPSVHTYETTRSYHWGK